MTLHYPHIVTAKPICGCTDANPDMAKSAFDVTCAECEKIFDDEDHAYHKEENAALELAAADDAFRRSRLSPADRAEEDEWRAINGVRTAAARLTRLKDLNAPRFVIFNELKNIRRRIKAWELALGQDIEKDYNEDTDPLSPK